jgi:hypothetical protein
MQTPHRFRTKRQLWAYIGLALKTHTSGEYRFERGQLQRSKKVPAIRGLNRNHHHDLKNIFKGAATWAASNNGPFKKVYDACVARGTIWRGSPWRPMHAFRQSGYLERVTRERREKNVGASASYA